jgi:hypothetical protein
VKKGWKKIVAQRACDIIEADKLGSGSQRYLDSEISPEALIIRLSESSLWSDAISVIASALPRREAVWWACVCSRKMPAMAGDESDKKALDAAEKWVFKPSDKSRSESFRLVQESTSASAGTLAALAVACSDSKLGIGGDQEIMMDSSFFPQIIAASVLTAAGDEAGEPVEDQFSLFIKIGENIAKGGNGHVNQ